MNKCIVIKTKQDFPIKDTQKLKSSKRIPGKRIGEIQEKFGTIDLVENYEFSELISSRNKKTGFDGIFISEEDEIYIYESKFIAKGTFNSLESSANSTISKFAKKSRTDEADNAKVALWNLEKNKSLILLEDGVQKIKKINNEENLKRSIKIISEISNLLADEATTKKVYEEKFNKLENLKTAVYLGTKKQGVKIGESCHDHVALIIYEGDFNGL